jgi:hypothetical protein
MDFYLGTKSNDLITTDIEGEVIDHYILAPSASGHASPLPTP